jgi:ABC-type Fe3+ transport system substrate-binding protein
LESAGDNFASSGLLKNSAHPNLTKLFVAFMAWPEAQRIAFCAPGGGNAHGQLT